MATLVVLENPLDRPVEEQLKQLNLNAQAEISWSKTVKNSLLLNVEDNSTTDTTSSLEYQQMPGFSFSFIPTSNLVNYKIKLNLQTSANASIGVFINNSMVDEYVTGINASHTLTIDGVSSINGGVSNSVTLKWKMLAAGTLTKYNQIKNKIQIVSLIV